LKDELELEMEELEPGIDELEQERGAWSACPGRTSMEEQGGHPFVSISDSYCAG
jgi:hypothetical protein